LNAPYLDSAGNTTQKVITEGGNTYTTSYTYCDDNRIKTITLPDSSQITYTYHADGTRATKTTPTEYIQFHYSGSLIKEVHANPSNHSQIYFTLHFQPSRMIYDPGSPGGGDELKYYTVTDTQGTVYKLLDSTGSTVASYTYDPFGNRLTNSAPTIYNPIGFAGTYYDYESGLYFAQSRYLDPVTSRFTTKDSYRGDLGSHISQNRYIYCVQNPTSFTDPSGFSPTRENDGTKNLLILDSTDPDSSSSKASSNPHTSTPKGNTIHLAPDDVVLNPDCYGNDLKPPDEVMERKKVGKQRGKTWEGELPKPGETIDIGDGEFLTNIGGSYIRIVILENGRPWYTTSGTESINNGGPGKWNTPEWSKACDTASGINAGLQDPAVRAQVGNSLGSLSSFNKEQNDFYINHYADYKQTQNGYNTGKNDYVGFFFHSTRGYAFAKLLLSNPGMKEFLEGKDTGKKDRYGRNHINGVLDLWKKAGGDPMTAMEFLMSIGFWASNICGAPARFSHAAGSAALNDPLSDLTVYDTGLVVFGMFMTASLGGTRLDENGSTLKSDLQNLKSLLTTLVDIGGGYLKDILLSCVDGLISDYASDRTDMFNAMGISFIGFCYALGYGCVDPNYVSSDWKTNLFLVFGMGSICLKGCLNVVLGARKEGQKGIIRQDLLLALNLYYDNNVTTAGGITLSMFTYTADVLIYSPGCWPDGNELGAWMDSFKIRYGKDMYRPWR
jgi:RHS repeat-associated protein